jgi:multiple sugar transport system permease protein
MIVATSTTALSVALGTPAAMRSFRVPRQGGPLVLVHFEPHDQPDRACAAVYLLCGGVRILNTHLVLVLIYLTFNLPIVVWICTDQFRSIPRDLEQSARLEGATQFDVFWRIYLPLGLPGAAVSAIFIRLAPKRPKASRWGQTAEAAPISATISSGYERRRERSWRRARLCCQ